MTLASLRATARDHWPPALSPTFRVATAALLVADLALIALFGAYKLGWVTDLAFHIGEDGGHGEVLQYAKLLWAGVGALWFAHRTREPVCAVLAVLLLVLLLDDGAMLHERAGEWLAVALSLPAVAGLRPQDLGEVLFLATWAGPLFVAGALAYGRSGPDARAFVLPAVGAIALLAGFGVGVDLVHQMVTGSVEVRGLDSAFMVLEEGGEMVALSILVGWTADRVVARVPVSLPARLSGRSVGGPRDARWSSGPE